MGAECRRHWWCEMMSTMVPTQTHVPRVVLVDWGGVLTPPMSMMWSSADDADHAGPSMGALPGPIARQAFVAALSGWHAADAAEVSPAARFERGETSMPEFEQALSKAVAVHGWKVPAKGLLPTLMQGASLTNQPFMDALAALHAGGMRLGVLSNSWGPFYNKTGWEIFEDAVLSRDVGLRKPEPEIFHLACERLNVEPGECLFVDDLQLNIDAARAAGMTGVLFTSTAETLRSLARHLPDNSSELEKRAGVVDTDGERYV